MNTLHAMNYDDLNFLYLIDALYRERSVSRAALRLDLTQPAVSHGLARMRAKFGDELFVRSGAGMAPTPVGERIALGARRVLDLIQSDIWDGPTFHPATSTRTFAVGMTDMGGTVILPRVISALAVQAPGVTIKPVAVRPREVSEQLESGAIDAAWGYFGNLGDALYQQTLFRRALTGIVGKQRREAGPIDFDAFVQARHVMATATTQTNALLEQKVKERGATLRVALEVPYLLAIPGIVAGSDYLATVPAELADLFLRLAEIEVFELPLAIPAIAVKQYWHARYHVDAGNQWFRSVVKGIFAADADDGAA
ncbi:LysR family transcriptional regulator [Massilia putida]|uniref:LysR family transcriptional regulator n=1 Tax=Massilia putida TaxID=1141883 RepID=UPI001E6541DD|nr:LysR family transcriptional regulator [Massilia putida]